MEREPGGTPPRSLRAELLFNLAFLAGAALLLALWTASVLQLTVLSYPQSLALLALLVVLDILVFVALGNYLIERQVLRPLAEVVEAAEAIGGGDYERRVRPGPTPEMAALAAALNHLTEQMLQNQERLAENVRSLDHTNRLLTEAQRELVQSEKMASIGRLAAGIAHEIGNPLGALVGYAGVLRRRGASGELLDGIDREARRIDQIVRGLLEYARPGSLPRERVDINESVRRAIDILQRQGHLAGIELRLDLAEGLALVDGVPGRIDQIFINLFRNAEVAMQSAGSLTVVTKQERYIPERTYTVRRADDPPGVDYSHLRRMAYGTSKEANRLLPHSEVVRVIVADTGPGIDPEHIDFVFDPFYTTKGPGEGTGLGLAIVASTVAELGGRIEASSISGGGATFTLSLPLAEDPTE